MKWLEGKKTYIAAFGAIALGIAGAFFGLLDFEGSVLLIVTGLGFFGLRDALGRALAERIAARAAEEGAKRRGVQVELRKHSE